MNNIEYRVGYNQVAVIKRGLSMREGHILDYIIKSVGWARSYKHTDGLEYRRIQTSKMVNDLPSIGSGRGTFQKNIKSLCEKGLIHKLVIGNYVYYRCDDKCLLWNTSTVDELLPKEKKEDTNSEEHSKELEFFVSERWNALEIHGHKGMMKVKKITEPILNVWIRKRKRYSVDEIVEAMETYGRSITKRESGNRYFHHRFSLLKFLKQDNGLEEFINYEL